MNLNDIKQSYEKIRKLSQRQIAVGNFEEALRYIETAARIAYNFNWIYSDDALEGQLKTVSEQLLHSESFVPQAGRVVVFDSFGWDSHGLTQQYVRALKSLNMQFLFVFENEISTRSREIRLELDSYENCEIFSVDQSLSFSNRLRAMYERILAYRPEKLLMHISPWAVEAIVVFHALASVTKYQINLTDHAFWLGTSCLDYSIEFRNYGCTVSIEKRQLDKLQILINPYYPVTSGGPFQGFPNGLEQRIVIFSGSSFYKIYGRDGTYFSLVKRLLTENPEAVLLFAGSGDERLINKFIAENHLEKRFLLLGNRTDINEVFVHCDIYLGTYPICGGLMSQLAAVNSKPILAYTTPDISCNNLEGIICYKQDTSITFTEQEAFFAEARKLVSNEEYRKRRGTENRNAMISSEDFNRNFEKMFNTNRSPIGFESEDIDYESFTALYLEVENNYQSSLKSLLLGRFRYRVPFLFPVAFLKMLPSILIRK